MDKKLSCIICGKEITADLPLNKYALAICSECYEKKDGNREAVSFLGVEVKKLEHPDLDHWKRWFDEVNERKQSEFKLTINSELLSDIIAKRGTIEHGKQVVELTQEEWEAIIRENIDENQNPRSNL